MKSLLAAALGCMCLLSASFAKADITFCNNHSSRSIVAVGFVNLNTILMR